MQFIPFAKVELDLTKPLEETKQLILTLSLSQPNQYEFFKQLDLWMGETITKIEEVKNKMEEVEKENVQTK
ncbi:hypothetical protein [Paenibacillus thermotolerans]|uniref:hypothetical protein n=1 Tax=Paenibacillus thermotolerans TaxID=3027807 RepID=UPI00236784D7|nr:MULTISPECIES: hypothetical protein [unclassified Paenibacillus]